MTTLTDCLRVITEEVSNWLEYPTDAQIHAVARELFNRCFGQENLPEVWKKFDVDLAFRDAGY
jgi:hypothetical protein